eukprot:jgi/Tetstr1/438074/TSEL_026699.t1
MSDDEMKPRRGKGSSGRLWAGHEKATAEHTFETWKNSTDCAMEKEQQHAFDRNTPFHEIHERLEGAERLDSYRRLLDGMWEELVNITKQIELHSERDSK